MQTNNRSILTNILNRFTGSFASVIGFFVAFFLFFAIIGKLITSSSSAEHHILPVNVHLNKHGKVEALSSSSSLILQIDIEGIIGDKKNNKNTSTLIRKVLDQPSIQGINQERIKGILLRINSPGGSAADCDNIYKLLMEYKKKHNIPIYAWIGDLCASAGYYIACTADHISAQRISIIGSVGVIFGPNFNIYKFMQNHGIAATTISAGTNKQHFPMFSPMPKGTSSYTDLIAITDSLYERFLFVVTKARTDKGLSKDDLIKYGATVYGSEDAVKLGYIDQAAVYYEDGISDFAKMLKIEQENYQVINFSTKQTFMNSMRGECRKAFSFFTKDETRVPFSLEMRK